MRCSRRDLEAISDTLGRIYGWISPGDLLGIVTRVPYIEELYMERNTDKLKLN